MVSGLRDQGFAVVSNAVTSNGLRTMAAAYDRAILDASLADIKVGRSSTRVTDFVNRGIEFDDVYLFQPLLDASRDIIGPEFKLSSFHARTLRPFATAGEWHVDVDRTSEDWPIVSFILMIDEFRLDNGATRFVRGSHLWPHGPTDDEIARHGSTSACGPAGSILIFHGSVWHGYSANTTDAPRRSLQGAMIPRAGRSATNFTERMTSQRLAQLGPQARYLVGL